MCTDNFVFFCDSVSGFIFTILPPYLIATMALLASLMNLYKYLEYNPLSAANILVSTKPIYVVRALNWFTLAVAFYVSPGLPVDHSRALIRISIGLMVFSELAYNYTHIIGMFRWGLGWIRRLLHLS